MWIFYEIGSSFLAGITAILAKCGIKKTDSDVATAIRTIVVLLFSWLMVLITRKEGAKMNIVAIHLSINIVLLLAICAILVYLVFLLIKALKKYIKSEPVRKEKAESAKSLGEVLKRH